MLIDEKRGHIATDAKKIMDNFMELQLITITAHSVLIVNCYLQHAVAFWFATEIILYHMYLILHGQRLLDAFSFV